MNKEIEKAIKAKQKEHPFRDRFRKWWSKNGYKVMRVILFPVWLFVLAQDWIYNHIEWSEERADKLLNYFVPRYCNWDDEEKTFYFFSNSYGWYFGSAKHYLKIRDYLFWKRHHYKIQDYLINKFELEGFEKKASYDWESDFTEITFNQK